MSALRIACYIALTLIAGWFDLPASQDYHAKRHKKKKVIPSSPAPTPAPTPVFQYKRAVTNELGGGRFGDKLLGYAHAKWIAYKYQIPLLYQSFIYSNQLVLDREEQKYSPVKNSEYMQIIYPQYGMNIDYTANASVLYIVPYFPDCPWELQTERHYSFDVDWDNVGFKQELKRLIKPLQTYDHLDLPLDRITVAVHVRRGGGFDTDHARRHAPLKLPPDSYYIDQMRRIYNLLGEQPLYFFIFTDETNPSAIVENYKQQLQDLDVTFGCRIEGNNHYSNVLEDFFEIPRFDCLIRPESNFTVMASKIADFKIIIKPSHFKWENDRVLIDEVEVEVRHKDETGAITKNSYKIVN